LLEALVTNGTCTTPNFCRVDELYSCAIYLKVACVLLSFVVHHESDSCFGHITNPEFYAQTRACFLLVLLVCRAWYVIFSPARSTCPALGFQLNDYDHTAKY